MRKERRMNHNLEEIVHTERVGKFDISLYFGPEDSEPDWSMTTGERTELMTKIDNGTLLWFVAHVVASKNGIELGHDYLGRCCYSSVAEFLEPGGYYEDMKREA